MVDVVHDQCAGVDVSKRDAKVCVRIAGAGPRGGARETVTTWRSMTNHATCAVGEVTERAMAALEAVLSPRSP
ncbi:hypothetical protein A6V29_00660 [Blastococcus sp. CCUG 61487]|nr:hypothetical protein A6V29_00660 [Blastococcus sp. CCUG 61487]